MPSERRRLTIADVARAAGVSPATAGRALGAYGFVREEVRARVRDAAKALGYRPNIFARGMITGRTNTIGVVGADIENPFFASAMRGICDIAREAGFGTILTNSDEDVAIECDAVNLLLEKQVDGIILSPADVGATDHLRAALTDGRPLVLLDRAVESLGVDAVVTDGVAASRTATSHLIARGHVRIAIVAELRASADANWPRWLVSKEDRRPAKMNPSGARLLGYIQAHEEAGLSIDPALICATGAYTSSSARRQTELALDVPLPPTAIYATDNVMALGAFEAIRARNLRVPADVSLLAHDDVDWMRLVEPTISAVHQPVYEMGRVSAQLLIERIRRPTASRRQVVMDAVLVPRQSVARLSSPS